MDKMLEIEYHPGEEIVLRFCPPQLPGLSPEAREHLRSARKEALLAVRSLVDAAIACGEKPDDKGPEKKRRTKVEVQ